MADLSCVICDYKVPVEAEADEVLALLGTTSPDAGKLLIAHMEGHSLADWVRAFKMADTYIDRLEAQLAAAQQDVAAAKAMAERAVTYAPPTLVTGPDNGAAAVAHKIAVAAAPGQPGYEEMFTPAERARHARQAQIRAEIEAADPDESLIPYIPSASRPEGVVGRKM